MQRTFAGPFQLTGGWLQLLFTVSLYFLFASALQMQHRSFGGQPPDAPGVPGVV